MVMKALVKKTAKKYVMAWMIALSVIVSGGVITGDNSLAVSAKKQNYSEERFNERSNECSQPEIEYTSRPKRKSKKYLKIPKNGVICGSGPTIYNDKPLIIKVNKSQTKFRLSGWAELKNNWESLKRIKPKWYKLSDNFIISTTPTQ